MQREGGRGGGNLHTAVRGGGGGGGVSLVASCNASGGVPEVPVDDCGLITGGSLSR